MNPIFRQHQTDEVDSGFSDFLNRIAVGVYRSSIEGELIFGNKALAGIFGFDSVRQMRACPLVQLYRSKKDRGRLIQDLMRDHLVEDRMIEFKRRNGTYLWGSVTAFAVLDPKGNIVFIDGTVRDVTAEKEIRETLQRLSERVRSRKEFPFVLDGAGLIVDIDASGAERLGYRREEMIDNPMSAYIAPNYRTLFSGFLSDVIEKKQVEGILIFNDRNGRARHLEVHARAADRESRRERISGIARDITRTVESQQQRLSRERFQGVLEMAGGVVHRLNQPLTVVTNLVNELAAEVSPESREAVKLRQIQHQVGKLNEIAKKIGNIRKYKSMDYVAGVRIVDIDQAT